MNLPLDQGLGRFLQSRSPVAPARPIMHRLAKGLEQGATDRVIGRVPFRVPLHRQGKARGILDIDRFGGSIGRIAINDDIAAPVS